jgi:polysaccharide biosynthesis transport protein
MARRLEAKLEQAVTEQRARVTYQSRLRDEAAKGLLELASAQEAYKRALDGRDQITFAVGIGPSSNVELISRATPPMAPSKPNVPAGAALGAVAALMLGLAVPLSYGLFHRRVRCRDDLERHHGLPVLAEFARIAKSTS